jgi:hypothetical protein
MERKSTKTRLRVLSNIVQSHRAKWLAFTAIASLARTSSSSGEHTWHGNTLSESNAGVPDIINNIKLSLSLLLERLVTN